MSVLLPYGTIRQQLGRLSWRLRAVTRPRLLVVDAGDEDNVIIQRGSTDLSIPGDSVNITGLHDWSKGLFGDPLLCTAFESPSAAFTSGWRPEGDEDLIEDPEGVPTRMLMYRCYRAVVSIVTEYYRPRKDSSRWELDARKVLTTTLAELEKADVASTAPPTPKRGWSPTASRTIADGAHEDKRVKRVEQAVDE
jgi:hypothetical protein